MMAEPREHSEDSWPARHPFLVLGLIIFVCLGPFANKAIQTDDALFVWTGQWIQHHPLDFYGGTANWWSKTIPMWMANWNPPLLPYVFACVAALFGWNEIPLHILCMTFAFAAAAGIYRLAKMWCARPLLATVLAIFTPAFLVSSTTLMCDVPMLAFWIWSVVIFEAACTAAPVNSLPAEPGAVADEHVSPASAKSLWPFVLAGLLASLAILTKYSAMMLLPLLAAMGILRSPRRSEAKKGLRKAGWWLMALIVPAIFIAGYELLTAKLYGRGLIFVASHFAETWRFGFPGGSVARGIIAFTFAGGSFLPILFLTPWLWRWRTWMIGGPIFMGTLIWIYSAHNPGLIHAWEDPGAWNNGWFRFEVALLEAAGAQLILMAAIDLLQRRDNVSVILFLWIIGVFVFAGLLNWSINVRSFLPGCPAVAILAVRRIEAVKLDFGFRHILAVPMGLAAAVTLILVVAEFQEANSRRTLAGLIAAKYGQGHTLWIEGHAGFQYYLQKLGGQPVDGEKSLLEPGDVIAVSFDSGTVSLPPGSVTPIEGLDSDPGCWMNLWGGNRFGRAGFYGADDGPVPFVIGDCQPTYFVASVFSQVQYRPRPGNENGMEAEVKPLFPKPSWSLEKAPDPAAPENPEAAKQIQLASGFAGAGQLNAAINCYRKALDLDATNTGALTSLAWILATADDAKLRDGTQAVQLALQAANLTKFRQPIVIGTLAAAFAEKGDFPNALATAKLARDLALLTGQTDVATRNEELMDLYASGGTVSGLRRWRISKVHNH